MKSSLKYKKGFGMIEMIVGSAILTVALLSISSFFQTTLLMSGITQSKLQSEYLIEEGIEAIKLMRDTNYTNNLKNLSDGTYYLTWTGVTWATTSVNTYIDGKFERSFDIASVQRDGSSDIGIGSNDPNTKLVTVHVSWDNKGVTSTQSVATYVMNIFNN